MFSSQRSFTNEFLLREKQSTYKLRFEVDLNSVLLVYFYWYRDDGANENGWSLLEVYHFLDMILVIQGNWEEETKNCAQVMDDNDAEVYYFPDKPILNDENLKRMNLKSIDHLIRRNKLVGLLIKLVAVAEESAAVPLRVACNNERIKRPDRFCTFGVCR